MSKESKAVKEAREYIDDFPLSYDAHKDGLNEHWDHCEAVNKLLAHLRAVLNERK
jgi:hypothetical protein